MHTMPIDCYDDKDDGFGGMFSDDMFSLVDDSIFTLTEDDFMDENKLHIIDWKNCSECNVQMQPMEYGYACPSCNRSENINMHVDDQTMANNNSNDICSTALKFVGSDIRGLNQTIIKFTADNKKTQDLTTSRQLLRCNDQFKNRKIPKTILMAVAEQFSIIQKSGYVLRGNIRLGTLAACLSFECVRQNITKKPQEIARFFGIEETHLSKGDKLLRELYAKGIIDIPIHHNPINSYLIQYFELLSIDTKYIQFATDIIERTAGDDIIGENSSKPSTQCVGVIWLLNILEDLKISRSVISTACTITKPTYERYYSYLLKNHIALDVICDQYEIKKVSTIKVRVSKKKTAR